MTDWLSRYLTYTTLSVIIPWSYYSKTHKILTSSAIFLSQSFSKILTRIAIHIQIVFTNFRSLISAAPAVECWRLCAYSAGSTRIVCICSPQDTIPADICSGGPPHIAAFAAVSSICRPYYLIIHSWAGTRLTV